MKLNINSAKKLLGGKNMGGVFFLLIVLVAGMALASYSTSKGSHLEMVATNSQALGVLDDAPDMAATLGQPSNNRASSVSDNYTTVPQGSNGNPINNSCQNVKHLDNPRELLPNPSNNQFSVLQPGGNLGGVNLLKAGHHMGIDTVGQSLRNANLQLRSEPPNPQLNVGPWMNTTIQPDLQRRPLEIGCQC